MQTLTNRAKTADTIDPKLEAALAQVDRAFARMAAMPKAPRKPAPAFTCGEYCEGCSICTDSDYDGGRFDWETSRGVS